MDPCLISFKTSADRSIFLNHPTSRLCRLCTAGCLEHVPESSCWPYITCPKQFRYAFRNIPNLWGNGCCSKILPGRQRNQLLPRCKWSETWRIQRLQAPLGAPFGVGSNYPVEYHVLVCLKMVSTPLYPMVLLIIIPMKNG